MQIRKSAPWATAALFTLLGLTGAAAQDFGGFMIGDSFADAEANAQSHGWTLVEVSADPPAEWRVDGTDLTIFICQGGVHSLSEQKAGSFHDFAALASDMLLDWGPPEVRIENRSGDNGPLSAVAALFRTGNSQTSVRFVTYGDNHFVSRDNWIIPYCTE